jgi:hypothetical protein
VKVERALAWYCHILLDRHQHIIVATVGRDGLPQLARVPYRREGDDVYIALAPDSPIAAGLGTVGPVAALLAGDDSLPLVSLSGAAESIADSATVTDLRSGLPDAGADDALYRLMPDTVVPLRGAMGECEVSRVTGSAPQVLAQLQAGNYFGESGLLAGAPRNASVIARGDVTVVSLSRTAFSTILHYSPSTAADLARAICAAADE